jgi:hypothetical protein
MGFDIRALPTHSLGDDEQPSLRHRRKSGIRRQGDALALSLHKASVSEFYLSLVATNPYIYPWVLPALVREAHRILRAEGLLVFFNGYPRSQHSVVVDFTDGRTHLLCSHASRKQSYCSETVGLLGDLFKALTLEEHKLFLAERGLTGAYELEPGKEVSVLVRKTLTR